MERAAATWSGKYWKTGTGGTVWNGITFDPELNQIYIGVGNGGPYDVNRRSPGDGDNLYLSSIVALDADTGQYVWHYQTNPREAWDYKCTANMIAATLKISGKPRKKSEERRVGKEFVSPCRSRWWPCHFTKKYLTQLHN